MADTIHKKQLKKNYPHFDKFYVGSHEYEEGYERIFGKKVKNEKTRSLKSASRIQGSSEEDSQEVRNEKSRSNSRRRIKKSKQKGEAKKP